MIEVRNLTKCYGGNIAVDNISFDIEPGHIYGFLGPNGAGKSTTMNMITGCLAPTLGEVRIDGKDILKDAKNAKKLIGYLPEIPPVYPELTPLEYLLFVAEAKGVKGTERYDQVFSAMEETDLIHVKDRLIKNLSKGYKQRVGIAQAMLGSPKLIILDEPTVGLDPKQITEIRGLIKRLGETRTIILSSHILSEVSAVCDRVMMIAGGRLIAFDTLENIRKQNSVQNHLLISAKADRELVCDVLSGFEQINIVSVTENGDVTNAEIELLGDEEIEEKLFFAFAKRNVALIRLASREDSLEEVFLRMTDIPAEEYEDSDGDDEEYDGDLDDEDNIADNINEARYDSDEDNKSDENDYQPLFGRGGEEE